MYNTGARKLLQLGRWSLSKHNTAERWIVLAYNREHTLNHPHCRINLPGHGIISTGLQVCNTFEMTLRNGLACKRSGCRFVDILESDRGLVQRYITQQEREQRSKGLLG